MKKLIRIFCLVLVFANLLTAYCFADDEEPEMYDGLLIKDVRLIQLALLGKGYELDITGRFDADTDAVVRKFQEENGLDVDGFVGKNTQEKLGIRELLERPDVDYGYYLLAGAGTEYRVIINRDTKCIFVFLLTNEGWIKELESSCVVGTSNTPTPAGKFKIETKNDGFYKNGYFWPNMTSFYGDYGIHSLPYKNGELADSRLGEALSHGCVRVAREDAIWIQENVPIGSDVKIF